MKNYNIFILLAFTLSFSAAFGQFGPINYISQTMKNIEDVTSGDIDNDGYIDVISTSLLENKVIWQKNVDGLGTFGRYNIISTNVHGAKFVLVGDLDNDNDLDVVVSSSDSSIYIFKNDGTGNFVSGQIILTNSKISGLFLSDVDNDNRLDIIYCKSTSSGNVSWFKNTGNAIYSVEQVISETGDGATSVCSADIDGDNDNDIIVTSYFNNYVAYYENEDGLGTFATKQIVATPGGGDEPNYVITSDINGDNDIDIIYSGSSSIRWIENNGNGSFGSPHLISVQYSSVKKIIATDIDNDNDNDILSVTYNSTNKICLFKNPDGLGSFDNYPIVLYEYAYSAKSISVTDIDNDNDIDILLAYNYESIRLFKNIDGQGNLDDGIYVNQDKYLALMSCDIDGDGLLDVVFSNYYDDYKISWYKNIDGQGSFGFQEIVSTNVNEIYRIFGGDIDNDGDIDIIASTSTGQKEIIWFENTDGNGIFGAKQIIIDSLSSIKSVKIADIDNDGDIDVIMASNSFVRIYKNDGNGVFTEQEVISNINYLSSIDVSDIDNDNDLDIVVSSNSSGSHRIVWFENVNSVFNTEILISNIDTDPIYIATSDINNDGNVDVLSVSDYDEKVSWYPNTGQGIFGSQQVILNNINTDKLMTLDVDVDGDIDVVTIKDGHLPLVYKNIDGQGHFEYLCNIPKKSIFADINSDGAIDLVATKIDGETLIWEQNYYNSDSKIKGYCYIDLNQNGNKDNNETGYNYLLIETTPLGLISFTDSLGNFTIITDLGNYILSYLPLQNWNLTTDSTEYHVNLTTTNPIIDSLNFGFYPDTFFTAINPEVTASGARCGEGNNLWINYQNTGTTTPNGVIELILDTQITYVSSVITPDSIVNNSLYWHFDTLHYFASEQISLTVLMPDFNSIGDVLTSVLNIYTTDSTGTGFFTDTLSEELICSYDPNDKLVTPKGEGVNGIISNTETLEYTVRFQNTGNAEAINIKIRDQIDEDVDIQTMQILASSHNVQAYVQQNRWLVFQFDSIMLPDSSTSFLESQGFVKYSIRVSNTALPNAPIYNTANIYFDNNPAVITNTVLNTVECYITPTAPSIEIIDTVLSVTTPYQVQWYVNDTAIFGATETSYYTTMIGDFTVEVFDDNGCSSFSDVFTIVNINKQENKIEINIYPNPTTGIVTVKAENIKQISVLNIEGKQILSTTESTFNLNTQAKGIYIVKIATQNGVVVKKVVLE